MSQANQIRFSEIELCVPTSPGIYQIHTLDGVALKVGIGVNLRKRLIQHRRSRQSRLKLKPGGDWSNPADVSSTQSILTKHLYFSPSPAGYDLKSEAGRQAFLEEQCRIQFQVTQTREEAREMEKILERSGGFAFARPLKNLIKKPA